MIKLMKRKSLAPGKYDPKPTATNGRYWAIPRPIYGQIYILFSCGFIPACFQRGMSRSVEKPSPLLFASQLGSWLFLAINWACVETRAINSYNLARNSVRTGQLFVFL